MRNVFTLLLISVVFLFSCNKSDNCKFTEQHVNAPQSEVDSLQNYINLNSIDAVRHSSGLFYHIDSTGAGTSPTICSTIAATYTGSLLSNGSVFESQTDPVLFALGNVIIGWQKGLQHIKNRDGFTAHGSCIEGH